MRRLALLSAVLFLASCARQELTLLSEGELPADVYGSPAPMPELSPLPKRVVIYLVDRGRLDRVRVTLQQEEATSLPEALLSALFLQAPQEAEGGVRTEIPEGTTLNGVDQEGTVATVDVSGEFEQAAPPRSQALRIAQVVYTLTEPETGTAAVRFEINGVPQVAIGDVDLRQIAGPVTREDFATFDPREGEAGA